MKFEGEIKNGDPRAKPFVCATKTIELNDPFDSTQDKKKIIETMEKILGNIKKSKKLLRGKTLK